MRYVDRLLAPLLALVLLAAGVITAVEVVGVIIDRSRTAGVLVPWPAWYRHFTSTGWDATGLRVAWIVIGVVGLLLLLAEVKRRRPAHLPLASDNTTRMYVTRRSLRGAIARDALDVDGVAKAKVRLRRRRAVVRVHTRLADVPDVRDRVRARLDERLEALHLARRVRVRLKVKTDKESS